jgi:phage terminase small subunit
MTVGLDFTPREQTFIDEYLLSSDVKKACIAAGYKTRKPTYLGKQILNRPRVQAALRDALERRSVRVQISQDMVLRRIWMEATGEDEDGVRLKDTTSAARIRALDLMTHLVPGLRVADRQEITVRTVREMNQLELEQILGPIDDDLLRLAADPRADPDALLRALEGAEAAGEA